MLWLLSLLLAGAPAADARIDEKRVCRPAAAALGSRIKRRKICRTAAEWEESDRARRGADLTVKAPQPEAWERTRPQ